MRTLPRRRRALPAGLLAGALVSSAVLLGWPGTAAATSDVEVIRNGGFNIGNRLTFWSCGNSPVWPVSSPVWGLQATPGPFDLAQCSQDVPVEPSSTYTLTASVQGPYVFVGATGTGGPDPSVWSDSTELNTLRTTFTTGPSTTSVTVWFHGWYGQGPYVVSRMSLVGPGRPQPCSSTTYAIPVASASAPLATPTPGGSLPPYPSISPTPDPTFLPSPSSSGCPSS